MRSSGWLRAALIGFLAVAPHGSRAADPIPKSSAPPISEIEGKNLAQWVTVMKGGDASLREEAIRVIVLFPGPHSGDVVTALLDRCKEGVITPGDTSVRLRAIMALTILEVRKEEIPRIVKTMGERLAGDTQLIVRFHAALCLLRFGEDSKDAQSALIHGTESATSFELRRLCVRVLEMCGHVSAPVAPGLHPPPEPVVTKAILKCAGDPTSQVRLEAVIALGSMGPSTDKMLQFQTEKLLNRDIPNYEKDKTVLIWALVSSMALDKPDEVRVGRIKEYLKGTEPQRIRLHAVRALAIIGTRVKTVLPTLIALLQDKDLVVVAAACDAIAQFGEKGAPAIEALKLLINNADTNTDIKSHAIRALAGLGIQAKDAVISLMDLLKDKDPANVAKACIALAELGEAAEPAIKALTDLKDSKDADKGCKILADAAIKQIQESLKAKKDK